MIFTTPGFLTAAVFVLFFANRINEALWFCIPQKPVGDTELIEALRNEKTGLIPTERRGGTPIPWSLSTVTGFGRNQG